MADVSALLAQYLSVKSQIGIYQLEQTKWANLHENMSAKLARQTTAEGKWESSSDYIEESYIFDVSSPGLGRPLKKEKDYIRNMDKEVEIRTYRAINKCKEFYGFLKAYDKDSVTIADEDGVETVFSRADIALIRQAVHF